MSMFDVTSGYGNEKKPPTKVDRFIDGLAQAFAAGKNGLAGAATNLASGLTFGMVTQKTAAQGKDAEVIAPAVSQEVDVNLNRMIEQSNNYLLAPYRYAVARPLTTALLAANSNYVRQIDEMGTLGRVEEFRKAWNDSQRISPGQSIVGYVGDQVWGTQGVDKVDWVDQDSLDSFFSKGPQRYVSWAADTALSIGADPVSLAGGGAGKAARKLVNVPVTSKNLNKIVKDIDDAVVNQVDNNWAPAVGFFKENADNLDAIMSHSMVANNAPLATQISQTAKYGNQTGDYTNLATVLKVAVGDSKTIDDLYYSDTLAAQTLNQTQASVLATRDLIKNFDSNLPVYNSPKPSLTNIQHRNALKNLKEQRSVLTQRMGDERSALDVLDDIISEVPSGSINRQTVSKFKSIERARIKNAITFSDSYWGVGEYSPFVRVLHWLNPSSKLNDTPSYFAQIGNLAGDRSHLEYAARVKEYGRLTKSSGEVQRRFYQAFTALKDKGARGRAFDELDARAVTDIVKQHIDPKFLTTVDERVQGIIDAVATEIASGSINHRKATLTRLVDNNYMITDDFGGSVFLKHLQDFENQVVLEVAQKRAGAKAKPTAADVRAAKEIVKNIFKNVPVGESQIPNVHFGLNLQQFDNAIAEHSIMLNDLIEEVITSPRYANYTAADASELIKRFSDVKSGEFLISDLPSKIKEGYRRDLDSVTDRLDQLYNQVWKPTTLMGLKYPSRNTLEGWQRALAVVSEYSRDFGVSISSVFASAVDAGVRTRMGLNKAAKADAKAAQALLNKRRNEFDNGLFLGDAKIADALHNTSDSVISTFNLALEAADDILTNYKPKGIPAIDSTMAPLYDFAGNFGYRLSDVSNLPSNVSPVLYNAFYTNNHNTAFDIVSSMDARTVLQTAALMQGRLRNELKLLDSIANDAEFVATAPTGALDGLHDIGLFLSRMDMATQNMAAAVMTKAAVRDELETLGAKADISGMKFAGQGEFKLFDNQLTKAEQRRLTEIDDELQDVRVRISDVENRPFGDSEKFLHGTTAELKVGDVISPQSTVGDSSFAWATSNLKEAKSRAEDALGYKWNEVSETGISYSDFENQYKARLYAVVPVDSYELTSTGAIKSASGFKVVGEFDEAVEVSQLRAVEKKLQSEYSSISNKGLSLMMDDSYAGVIGDIMRKNVSAASSTLGAVFGADRVIVGNILNGRVKTGLVHPYQDGVLNPLWGRVSADYANRRFRDPVVRRFIDTDTSNPEEIQKLVAWAKSNDIEAKNWRGSMDAQLDSLRAQGVDDPVKHLVQSEALFVEGTLPNYTLDGRVVAPLKDADGNFVLTVAGERIPGTNMIAEESGQLIPGLRFKAREGTLTAEDMFMIPEKQRVSVSGNVRDTDAKELGRWRRFTENIFKYIGTLPEDNFVRHPVYRMIYQSEARRVANLWKQQGRTDDWINSNLGNLQEQAHRKAYSTVMERLYSVERKTNPAETLRFISPFYMAKQNSNRFWFGYAMRNPQAVGRYFLLWSSPSRVFDVENENGQDVEFVNPFWANGVAAKFTIAAAVAEKMGLPENSRMPVTLSSFDLINNGFLPFMPEFGSPLYDVTAGQVLSTVAGSPLDPELLLAKMGQDPEMFRKLVAPYVRNNPKADARDIVFNFLIAPNGWMRSFLAASSDMPVVGSLAEMLDNNASERFNSLTNTNYKMLYEEYAQQNALNPAVQTRESQAKVIADLTKEASALAVHTLLWESFFGFGPFVGNIKVEEYANIKAQELRLYQDAYGFDEGSMKFARDNTKIGEDPSANRYGIYTLSTAQGNSRETNPFGLAGTPQTVRAIQQNRELWDTVSAAAMGGDDKPDNKILGALFNQGDRVKDYSVTANNKLYSLGIKRPAKNDDEARRSIAVDMGYDVFFAIQDKYEALAASKGIELGSKEYKEMFKEDFDADVAQLEKTNPIWAAENSVFNKAKADNNVKTILAVLGDEKFMNSIGKKSELVEGLYAYMRYREPLVAERLALSDNLDTNIYDTNKFDDLIVRKENLIEQISAKYPEFATFSNFYLKRDPLFSTGPLAEVK